ncbi:MAG: hypothetical protein ABIK20_00685, partial [Candidatus Omnitrophota bacterium]
EAKSSIAGKGFASPNSALHLHLKSIRRLDADRLFIYTTKKITTSFATLIIVITLLLVLS